MAKRKKNKKAVKGRLPANSAVVDSVSRSFHSGKMKTESAQPVASDSPMFVWLLGFLIASVALVGPYGQKYGYTPDLHMSAYIQVFAFGLLAVLLISWFRRRTILFPRVNMIILPIALLYIWIALSGFWVLNFYEFLVDFLYWSAAIACGLLVLLLITDMKKLRWLLIMIFISGFLNALLGVGQFLFGIDWVQQHIVPATTFSNKNMAGQYSLLTLPLGITLFLEEKQRLRYWLYALASGIMIAFLFYTRSRAIWLSGLAAGVIFASILLYWRYIQGHRLVQSREKVIAAIVAAVLSVTMFSVTPATFGFEEEVAKASIGTNDVNYQKTSGLAVLKSVLAGTERTANVRTTIWVNSIPMFIDHFFLGVGFGNWIIHYPSYQAWFRQDRKLLNNQFHANAHNDYVEFLCEFGIIGTAMFVWLLIGLFKVIKRVLSKKEEASFSPILLGPAIALVAIGIDANFSFPLKQPVPIMLVFVYIAVFCCAYSIRQGRAGWYIVTLPARIYKQIGALILTAITAVLTVLQYQWYQTEIHYRAAITLVKTSSNNDRTKRAYEHARKAYEYNPLRKRLLWLEGTSLLRLGSPKKAISLLEETLAFYPYSDSTIYNLVNAYIQQGRTEQALMVLNQMRQVQPYQVSNANIKLMELQLKIFMALKLYEDAREIMLIQEARHQAHIDKIKHIYARNQGKLAAYPTRKRLINKVKSIERLQKTALEKLKKHQEKIAAVDNAIAKRMKRFTVSVDTDKSEKNTEASGPQK